MSEGRRRNPRDGGGILAFEVARVAHRGRKEEMGKAGERWILVIKKKLMALEGSLNEQLQQDYF